MSERLKVGQVVVVNVGRDVPVNGCRGEILRHDPKKVYPWYVWVHLKEGRDSASWFPESELFEEATG